MANSKASTDFTALVAQMGKAGAFDDYAQPGTPGGASHGGFHEPHFPGDRVYTLGPTIVKEGIKIPQETIDAQKTAFLDAMSLYMPTDTVTQWMHEYFAPEKNFMHSKSFRRFVGDLSQTPTPSRILLDPELTMQLDSPERKRTDQRFFTPEEMHITKMVSEKVPALPVAIAAYQASLVDYLSHLDKAVGDSKTLTRAQKKRGHDVVDTLKSGFSTKATMQHMLPAVATHYYKNHKDNLGEPVTEQDFKEGLQFLTKNGAFRQTVSYTDNSGEVRFSCPAQPLISKSSTTNLDDNAAASQPEPGNPQSRFLGRALHHIYREADAKIKASPQAFKQINRDMANALSDILTVQQSDSGAWNRVKNWLR